MASRLTIKDMHNTASDYGGKCLSKEYLNMSSPLSWMCSKGHTWDSSYSIVQQGGWCVQCAKNQTNLEKLQELARKFGGKCLSENYIRYDTKYQFECAKGHIFLKTGNSLKNGYWCEECNREKEISKIQQNLDNYATKKGGLRLSNYQNMDVKVKFRCSRDHEFLKNPSDILSKDSWCAECNIVEQNEEQFKIIRNIVKQHKGKCLSPDYKNGEKKLRFKCNKDHTFLRTPNEIKKGYWCAKCKNSEFIETRLKDMHNIAAKNGGKYLSATYKRSDVRMKWQCSKGHVFLLQPTYVETGVRWCPVCMKKKVDEGQRKYTLADLQRYAKEKGGLLLSKEFTSSKKPVKFQCSKGHIWTTTANRVLNKRSWCKSCAAEDKKISISDLRKIAKKRGGVLVSKEYINSKTSLTWKCQNGHTWTDLAYRIKAGNWCYHCEVEQQKITFYNQLKKIADKKGGKLLSKQYITAETKLKFQCTNGHTWMGRPAGIKQGSWCRKCFNDAQKLDIGTFERLAKQRGGKLLSKKYEGIFIKLKWQCKEGHIWMAVPSNIKAGRWCPVCAR